MAKKSCKRCGGSGKMKWIGFMTKDCLCLKEVSDTMIPIASKSREDQSNCVFIDDKSLEHAGYVDQIYEVDTCNLEHKKRGRPRKG